MFGLFKAGVLSADTSNVSLGGTVSLGTYNSKDVLTANSVSLGSSSLSLTGTAASNYVLVQPTSIAGTISPKSVTASGETANKTYDGTTSAAGATIKVMIQYVKNI